MTGSKQMKDWMPAYHDLGSHSAHGCYGHAGLVPDTTKSLRRVARAYHAKEKITRREC